MPEKYAELRLYFGFCDSRGLPEVGFGKLESRQDEYSQRKMNEAMQIAREAVDAAAEDRPYPWVNYGFDNFVADEKEARELIELLKAKVENAEDLVELQEVIHGGLKFYRKMRFNGLGIEDEKRIIDIIKESGLTSKLHGAINRANSPLVLYDYLRFFKS